MKTYEKPIIEEETLKLEDVIAESFGGSQPGDLLVDDFWDN